MNNLSKKNPLTISKNRRKNVLQILLKQTEESARQTIDQMDGHLNVFTRLKNTESSQWWNSEQGFHPAEVIIRISSLGIAEADVHYRVLVQFHTFWFPEVRSRWLSEHKLFDYKLHLLNSAIDPHWESRKRFKVNYEKGSGKRIFHNISQVSQKNRIEKEILADSLSRIIYLKTQSRSQ